MLAVGIFIAILISFIKGGDLANLEKINYHPHSKYIVILFIIEVIIKSIANLGNSNLSFLIIRIMPYFNIFYYLALISILELNRSLKYVGIIESGTILNFLPIVLNKGKMPVLKEALVSIKAFDRLDILMQDRMFNHSLINNETRFKILSDIIPLNFGIKTVISIGDIVIFFGMIFFIVHYTTDRD